jgi:putative phosphotransacetylase
MDINMQKIETLVRAVISQVKRSETAFVPVGVSNRHLHVDHITLARLFGEHYTLTKLRDLKQPGQFAAQETVEIIGPKGKLTNVRILGPVRASTQLEIAKTESYILGLDCPVRESGDLNNTPGVLLRGPQGQVELAQGVILALRHIHMPAAYASQLGYSDGQMVAVKFTEANRKLIYDDVKVRVSSQFALEMHLDTDEANAANLKNDCFGEIVQSLSC